MQDIHLFNTLTSAVPGLVWVSDEQGRVEFVNAHWTKFTGMSQQSGLGYGWLDAIHPADGAVYRSKFPLAPQQPDVQTEIRIRRHDGVMHRHLLNLRYSDGKWVGCAIDIHDWLSAELRDASQGRVLELLAAGAHLDEVLAEVCRSAEAQISGASCSILLVDSVAGRFVRCIAPTMPDGMMSRLPGMAIGTGVGSCGTAAFERRDVTSTDIATDPLWEGHRDSVLRQGYRACWSKPVFATGGEVIASFGFYFREPCSPTAEQHQSLARLRGLAAMAIERAGMLEALRESEAHYRFTVEQSPQIPWTADATGMVLSVSSRWTEMTGITQAASLGTGWLQAVHPDDLADTRRCFAEAVAAGGGLDMTYRVRVSDGDYRWARLRGTPRRGASGEIIRWYGSLEDVHQQHLAASKLQRQAYEDDLTGLPNRRAFTDALRQTLQQDSATVGLLILDMDDFKLVNDRYGHLAGDAVLRLFARYLQRLANPGEFVARLGGDEFALICRSVAGEPELLQRARVIEERLQTALRGNKKSNSCKPSIGCALGRHGDHPDEIFKRADLALYAAKGSGKGAVHLYTPMLRTAAATRSEALLLARSALSEDWIEAFYQPVLSLRDRSVLGFEALLRIRHPQRGLLTPDTILDALQDPRTARATGERMARLAIDDMTRWQQAGVPFGHVALNLATENVVDPNFTTTLLHLLDSSGLPPAAIKLELTERVLLNRSGTNIQANLSRLRENGIRISLDDFGTGYASLVHLQTLSIDEIKIDRSFVSQLGTDANRGEIVRAVLGLARALGLTTVAEGIETPGEALRLTSWGCDAGQGYLFSRPMPSQDVGPYLCGNPATGEPARWQ